MIFCSSWPRGCIACNLKELEAPPSLFTQTFMLLQLPDKGFIVRGRGRPRVDSAVRMSLEFAPFKGCRRGLIADLLASSYGPLLEQLPAVKVSELRRDWADYDDAVRAEPDTIGDSGFLTALGAHVIGFASWDPRGWPCLGKIGHNCIVPAYQGHGYGRRQIEEVLSLFRRKGFRRVQVRTDEHPFFEPARRMYERCGFEFVAREPGVLLDGFEMLVYEQSVTGAV